MRPGQIRDAFLVIVHLLSEEPRLWSIRIDHDSLVGRRVHTVCPTTNSVRDAHAVTKQLHKGQLHRKRSLFGNVADLETHVQDGGRHTADISHPQAPVITTKGQQL